jgi:hypothetical protein
MLEIFDGIANGFNVSVMDSPIEARLQAHCALDLAWESHE